MHYERIEPIAESFPDARHRDRHPRRRRRPSGQRWTGFHRLERDLWQRGDISRDGPLADRLVRDAKQLRGDDRDREITPDELGNGARSLMDEVAKGKVTGEEERYSHTDLVDFQGNLDGAKTAYAELRPIVADARARRWRRPSTRASPTLQRLLSTHASGTAFKPYTALDRAEVRALAARVDAVAEPLSRVTAVVLR